MFRWGEIDQNKQYYSDNIYSALVSRKQFSGVVMTQLNYVWFLDGLPAFVTPKMLTAHILNTPITIFGKIDPQCWLKYKIISQLNSM